MNPFLFAVCLFALLVVGPLRHASGQEKPAPPPDIVVQGTKTGTPLEQMTGAVTVINEAEIKSLRVHTVLEVLRHVEALDVVQSGGPGGITSLFLRGGESNHVLVLIDGVKVNNPTTGAFNAANLTVDGIERIEVLRGSQSPLYGSEAVAGVISIVTKPGRTGGDNSLSVEGGSYSTWGGALNTSGKGPVWDRTLSLSYEASSGFSKADQDLGNTEPDGYKNTTFVARLGRGVGVGGRLDVNLRLNDATTDYDDAFPLADSAAKSRDKAAVTGLTYSGLFAPWWDHRLTIGWARNHRTNQDTDAGDSDTDAQSRQVDWQHTLDVGPDNLLTVGYEYQSDSGKYTAGFGSYDERIVTNAVYVQDQLAALDPLFFTAGVRSDGNNRYGRHNTYKVGSSLALAGWRSRLFGNFATGFRAPGLDDLFFPPFPPFPPSSNPDLEPETSRGYEVGLFHDLIPKTLNLETTYFHTKYRDLIAFNQAFVLANIDSAEVTGVEVSTELIPDPKAAIQANYTYTSTHDSSTNDQLLRRPRNKANLALIFKPEHGTQLRADYRYVGDRLDVGGVTTPGYSLVSLAASREYASGPTLFVRVDNLFDRDYEEVTGFGTAGRSIYAGFTAKF
ncbi:MAG: TonB-dependent receptor [Nitrospirota bacterium]